MTHRQWGFQTYDGTQGKTIDDVVVIVEQEEGLYKLKGHPEQALIHDTVEPNKLWHRRFAHVHYLLQAKLLKDFQKSIQNMTVSAKDVRKGKHKEDRESNAKGILEIIHSDVCGPMLLLVISSNIIRA